MAGRGEEATGQVSAEGNGPSWKALLGLVGASVPMEIDPVIHNIAVVAASNQLAMSGGDRALAASLATLCIAAFILTTGSLGDRFGRRRVMLLGLAVAAAGGAISAVAGSTPVYLAGRAISGVGFAASFGLSFALLPAIASGPQALARAVATWLGLQTACLVGLSLIGGYLAGLEWRIGYLLSPVVALLALAWCWKTVPEARESRSGDFDAIGLALVAIGLVATLYGISNAASAGWGQARVLLPLLGGLVVLAAFALWEARHPQPAFPIRIFGDPQLLAGAVTSIGFNAAIAVIGLQLSLLWQYVYRYTPLEVSLGELPIILACIASAAWVGALVARGVPMRRLVVSGLLALAAMLAVLAFAGRTTPYWLFVGPLVVAGVAVMLAQTPAANAFVAKAPPALVGAIGSSRTAFGQFGYALGLALSSSLLYGMFSPLLRERLSAAGASPAEQAQAIGILRTWVQTHSAAGFDARLVHEVVENGTVAYLESYRLTLLAMAALLAVLAGLSFWILSRRAPTAP